MLTIIHNPRCSKSRNVLEFLKGANIKFEVYDYLSNGLSKKIIEEILLKGSFKIEEILRKNEADYKEFVKGKNCDLVSAIIKYPKLLQRPIVVGHNWALVVRDEKSLLKLKGVIC